MVCVERDLVDPYRHVCGVVFVLEAEGRVRGVSGEGGGGDGGAGQGVEERGDGGGRVGGGREDEETAGVANLRWLRHCVLMCGRRLQQRV